MSCNKRPALVQWIRGRGWGGWRGGDGQTECAAGRCAAAAPISGQTPRVCFLPENMACYTSAHTVPVSEPTYTTTQKMTSHFSTVFFVSPLKDVLMGDVFYAHFLHERSQKVPQYHRRVLWVCLSFIVVHCVAYISLAVTLQVISYLFGPRGRTYFHPFVLLPGWKRKWLFHVTIFPGSGFLISLAVLDLLRWSNTVWQRFCLFFCFLFLSCSAERDGII